MHILMIQKKNEFGIYNSSSDLFHIGSYELAQNVTTESFLKIFNIKNLSNLVLGFSLGVIAIWPGIISTNSRKCFFSIIKDGSDGNIQIKTILLINPNYLLRIKNAKNEYWKILLVGDACFRKF